MTAHKLGGGPSWRDYRPKPIPRPATESWWAQPQTWDAFSRTAASETERMRHAKVQYYWLSIDRFAIWG